MTSQVDATYPKSRAVLRVQWYLQWLSSSILSKAMVDRSFMCQNVGLRETWRI